MKKKKTKCNSFLPIVCSTRLKLQHDIYTLTLPRKNEIKFNDLGLGLGLGLDHSSILINAKPYAKPYPEP